MLLLTPLLALLALAGPATANAPNGLSITLFPALPEVTEINQNSYVAASIRTSYNAADKSSASIVWAIYAKRALTETKWDDGAYIEITTWPAQRSQVLTYYTYPTGQSNPSATKVAEAACKVESTTAATCQIMPQGGAPSESVYKAENIKVFPFVFNPFPAIPAAAAAARLVGSGFLGTVVAAVAVAAAVL
ncbi:hypothetical protein DRE_03819 [Drechslerella stenobrocha 248]|uniref:Ig-like domain-containing protein n=1 Tax=Drechslerella stenobrocha 248 TaxID=1043628 RepID=W7I3T4_9PEZI|nr:hypothetical protein DRE_03819 [Drechslerella stenobrocha 248]